MKKIIKLLVLTLALSSFNSKAQESTPLWIVTKVFPFVNMACSGSQVLQVIKIIQTERGEDISIPAVSLDIFGNLLAIATALGTDAPWEVWFPYLVPTFFDVTIIASVHWLHWKHNSTTLVYKHQRIVEESSYKELILSSIKWSPCSESELRAMLEKANSHFPKALNFNMASKDSIANSTHTYQTLNDSPEEITRSDATIFYHENFAENEQGSLVLLRVHLFDTDLEKDEPSLSLDFRCRVKPSQTS